MSLPDVERKRHSPRHRLGRLATMKRGVGIAPRYVRVTNFSVDGVRLVLNGIDIRDDFILLFHGNGGPARDGTYRVVWRQGQDIGTRFINATTNFT